MKNKQRLVIVGVSIALMAVLALYVHGLRRMAVGPQDEIRDAGRIFRELGLTAEQKMKLEENSIEQNQKLSVLMTALHEKRVQIEQALNDPAKTRGDIELISSELKSLQAKLTVLRLDGIYTVKAILTPEQFAKFQQMMAEKQRRRPEIPMLPQRRN